MTVYYTLLHRADNTQAAKDEQRKHVFSALLKKMGQNPHQDIKKDENGRPYLPLSPTIDINLSHADQFTVYAAGDTRLGIDIESPLSIRDPESLCRRFFTDGEQKQVQAAKDIPLAVCEIWTKKEALAKYIGNGLSKNLQADTTKEQKDRFFHTKFTTIGEKSYIITICTHQNAKIVFLDTEHFNF